MCTESSNNEAAFIDTNSGIEEFRDLGIEGIPSLLLFGFDLSIPQFLNP
ncbi:hypothetical protein D1AOALGA4SA_10126 [Olavius algarvensis Delta 1 endosymbiont]|nr:hypothetical protein D1AOALGA4SA_10126 [Olavius algarvensis Delta 1 endosymbiont]